MLIDWVVHSRRSLLLRDWLIVLAIVLVAAERGFLKALLFGVFAGCVIFAVDVSRIRVIRHQFGLDERTSSLIRSAEESALLAEHGAQVQILELSRNLFFGSAYSLQEQVTRCATRLDRYVFGVFSETFVRGQQQDQPAAIVKPVEPDVGWSGRAGVRVNHIGRIELDLRAVALQGTHIGLRGEIRRNAFGEAVIEFDRREPAALAHHVRQDRCVVAPGADVHDVLARLRRRRNQHRVQPRLAVVQAALWNDADQRLLIEIDRIVARRRYITARPAQHRPRPRPEEMFAAHRRERRSDARVIDVGVRQHMLGIGAPDDRQLIRSILSRNKAVCAAT